MTTTTYQSLTNALTQAKSIYAHTADPMVLSAMKLLGDPHMEAFVGGTATLSPQEQKALNFLTALADAYFVLHGRNPDQPEPIDTSTPVRPYPPAPA